jgi:hypothetical protein
MPFEKGHAFRPKGTIKRRSFNLPSIINDMFPGRETHRKQKIESLSGAMASKGKGILNLYLTGGATLTARQAIIAQCCECSGYYADGKEDCENPLCSLYPFMPYAQFRKPNRGGEAHGTERRET